MVQSVDQGIRSNIRPRPIPPSSTNGRVTRIAWSGWRPEARLCRISEAANQMPKDVWLERVRTFAVSRGRCGRRATIANDDGQDLVEHRGVEEELGWGGGLLARHHAAPVAEGGEESFESRGVGQSA